MSAITSLLLILAILLNSVGTFALSPSPQETRLLEPLPSTSLPLTSTPPLTPDGNLELIDDIQSVENTAKDFITIKTKNDQVFYIIIDRQRDGDQVYFLSQVDERSLLEILKEDPTNVPTELPLEPEVQPQIPFTKPPAEDTDPPQETQPSDPQASTEANPKAGEPPFVLMGLAILLLGLLPLGAIVYFVFRAKRKSKVHNPYAEFLDPIYPETEEPDHE